MKLFAALALAFTLTVNAKASPIDSSANSEKVGSSLALVSQAVSTATAESMTGSNARFAQVGTPSESMPIPTSLLFVLIGIFVTGFRLMGLRHALVMAEHERHSSRGRAETFRALQARR